MKGIIIILLLAFMLLTVSSLQINLQEKSEPIGETISFTPLGDPANIRKNSVTANFNQHHGYIESVDFNYTIVDKHGNEIETKVIDATEYFLIVDMENRTFGGKHSYAIKIEYWINQVLNHIKEAEGID